MASLPDVSRDSLRVLTLHEAANELRCSLAQIYNIQNGRVAGLPPLPVFHIGRRSYIRVSKLKAWIEQLETSEREMSYASGFFGIRDDEFEFIAGA
jgi:hypothetical protein